METIKCKIEIVETNIEINEAMQQAKISKQNELTYNIPQNIPLIKIENPYHCSISLNPHVSSKIKLEKCINLKCGEKISGTNDNKTNFKQKMLSKTHLHCNHCEYFTVKSNLISQNLDTKKNESYRCHRCVFSTECLKKLRYHQRDCKIKMCHICSYAANNYELRQHMKLHSNDKSYKCNHCGYLSSRKDRLHDHMCIKHDQIKNFVCDQCATVHGTARDLQDHYKIFHSPPIYKCDECEYANGHKTYLYRHKQRFHINKKCYNCSHCGYLSTNEASLHDHICIKHDQIKNFECDQCARRYSTAHSLQVHYKISHSPPIYKCDECKYAHGYKMYLNLHKKRFHNNKC